ncbi:putative PAP-specific phosphatase, mitochondrial isoform X2 [Medicago truncatula]|uniref:putative PAP-specific phosphatase, mitochondrial isoform X2 n=1 Tax=Medicago truncatula TaxID=3880 RepID=UPI000D2F2E10|nr:putative PAP-specific phosphatase, mitochondrial isoform X2 [Medicago truncatula]
MALAMDILRSSHLSAVRFFDSGGTRTRSCNTRRFNVRANLPFPQQNAKYHKELEAAIDVVHTACRLCVQVKSSLFSTDGKVLEKNDQTPVTVADFGVQALISLVSAEASSTWKTLAQDDVLKAIDRGGKDAFVFGSKPATYWVLDPIDGTRGFLKDNKALYVVGLALVVEGEIAIGVMGCPNWQEDLSKKPSAEMEEGKEALPESGIMMIAHKGYGTWTKKLNSNPKSAGVWTRCVVDRFDMVHKARFCIPDSQSWESLPLSSIFNATSNANDVGSSQIVLVAACCGSLCKYLMVASGRASVFIQRAKETTTIKAWDHAVGMICVHEAGGKVTDWEGIEIDLAEDQPSRRIIFPSGGVLVTNGNLHDQIVQIISQTSRV